MTHCLHLVEPHRYNLYSYKMSTVSVIASPLRRAIGLAAVYHGSQRCFSSSRYRQVTWGFIGLGQMGFPMAKNLRAKLPTEDVLFVQDVNTAATKKFLEEHSQGVCVAQNVREVAEKSDTVITVLPEPHHVAGVYDQMLGTKAFSKDGSFTKDRLFIDCSTIDPMTSASVAKVAHSSGQGKFIDAPMSGGVVGARAGTLTFMIGAAPDLVDRTTKVLSMMGKRVLHLGDQSAGLKGKLANNYLLALNNIATAEAMNMGIQWGLDPKALANMINISTGKCWPSEVNNPVPGVIEGSPASRGYEGGFGISLMRKDLGLAIKAAKDANVKLVLGEHAKALYDEAEQAENCKGRDFSVVYRHLGGKE
ncbi:NAD binding domain of 6-phosphogluconate dehydrogenase-domain-containing protein [Massariosphaeria phaeospora]|uniref:3-hydroxyisobutyrate dehydrogenase n=1 Tax=Massariosphaeria phaeospora TaxID=100035 RepID=A0A7C8I8K7_9PLEO|nr:NAD binding domain of 6-phosphogluconate dehydrogenase-domain-containing protein [Massariosphaeria phaeospora]